MPVEIKRGGRKDREIPVVYPLVEGEWEPLIFRGGYIKPDDRPPDFNICSHISTEANFSRLENGELALT